eukprot:GSA25T00024936001.1
MKIPRMVIMIIQVHLLFVFVTQLLLPLVFLTAKEGGGLGVDAALVDVQKSAIDRQNAEPMIFKCNHTACNDNIVYEDVNDANFTFPSGTSLITVYIYLTPLHGRTCNTAHNYVLGYDADNGVTISNGKVSSPPAAAYLIMPSHDSGQDFQNRSTVFNTRTRTNALLGVDLNTTLLYAGINYRICVDYDGLGTTYNWADS